MFEVNGVYANRKGEYTVLAINPPKMRVRFTEDGSEAELKIDLQERIWENIADEYEAQVASRTGSVKKPVVSVSSPASHYIKIISVPEVEEMVFPGWQEQVIISPPADSDVKLKTGDHLILYALETQTFFAVASIKGEPIIANPKDYFFKIAAEKAEFFSLDIEAVSSKLEKGADLDSVELESQPLFKRLPLEAEDFIVINEDDFELIVEAITEAAEESEEEDEEADDVAINDDDDFEEDEE